jgi:hypothetical protein
LEFTFIRLEDKGIHHWALSGVGEAAFPLPIISSKVELAAHPARLQGQMMQS